MCQKLNWILIKIWIRSLYANCQFCSHWNLYLHILYLKCQIRVVMEIQALSFLCTQHVYNESLFGLWRRFFFFRVKIKTVTVIFVSCYTTHFYAYTCCIGTGGKDVKDDDYLVVWLTTSIDRFHTPILNLF